MHRCLAFGTIAIVLAFARTAVAQSAPWGGSSASPIGATVPLEIRSERGHDTVQVGSNPLWLDGYGTPIDPVHDVCRTPCTLYVRPGRVPLSFAGVDGGTSHDIDVAATGARITLRDSPLLRAGLGLTIAGVVLTATGLGTLFAAEPDCADTGAQLPCSFERAGIATLTIASASLVAGLITMMIGRNQRIHVEPLPHTAVYFSGGALRF